jgi:hypothetical protein
MDGALSALVVVETPRDLWAHEIRSAWQSSVDGILRTGCLLVAAKADPKLPRGQFEAMIEKDLPFKPRTAQRLMKIARHQLISNATHVSLLPPSWGTLYELTRLPVESLQTRMFHTRQ